MHSTRYISRRQGGFSLVSMMIGMTLSLFIVAGIINLVVSASQGNQRLQESVFLIESGRFASQQLREELEHAGFLGGLFPTAAADWPAIPALTPDPCVVINLVGVISGLTLPIQGYDNPTGNPPPVCLGDSDHVDGTDIVFIRRADVGVTAAASAEAGKYYLQASAIDFELGLGADLDLLNGFGVTQFDAVGASVTTPLRLFHVDGYYVSPFTRPQMILACDGDLTDKGEDTPTLMRLRLNGLIFCAEPLANGVENLQIEYGIDDSGNGAPDRYTEAPANNFEWANVVSTRLFLLVRGQEPRWVQEISQFTLGEGDPGPDGTDTYAPGNDGYTRHVFSTTARLTNISARRELP